MIFSVNVFRLTKLSQSGARCDWREEGATLPSPLLSSTTTFILTSPGQTPQSDPAGSAGGDSVSSRLSRSDSVSPLVEWSDLMTTPVQPRPGQAGNWDPASAGMRWRGPSTACPATLQSAPPSSSQAKTGLVVGRPGPPGGPLVLLVFHFHLPTSVMSGYQYSGHLSLSLSLQLSLSCLVTESQQMSSVSTSWSVYTKLRFCSDI